MTKTLRFAFGFFVLTLLVCAQVGPYPPTHLTISDPSEFTAIYQGMVGQWFGAVAPYAYDLFYALAGLEIAVFGWNLWMTYGGDIRAAMMATANKVLILGFFLALLVNGQQWMGDIIQMFVTVGKQASGIPSLSPSAVLYQGFQIFGTMLSQAAQIGWINNLPAAIALILAAFIGMLAFLVITFQFVITLVQTYLALGMGYFFLGFGASRWTTSYVERYFAFSFAAGAKLMVLYLLTGAGWVVTNSWILKAQQVPQGSAGIEAAWLIMCGAVLYAGIVWNLSSLVSNFFGGGPNLGHGDAIALAAPIAGAAVSVGMIAAALATGGAAAVAGAAGKAAGSGAAAAAGAGKASGITPPQAAAPSSGGAGSGGTAAVGRAAGQMAQAVASAARQMPHGGSHSSPPTFTGFHH